MLRRRHFPIFVAVSLGASLAGCGRDVRPGEPAMNAEDARTSAMDARDTADGKSNASDAEHAPSDAAAETAPTQPEPPPPVPSVPLPAGVAPPRKLFGDEVHIAGDARSSCAHGDGPIRYCAFSLAGQDPGTSDLWVLDVAAAAAANVPCDGGNPACQKVHSRIWTGMPFGGPSHPFAHAFDGDTLVVYGEASTNVNELHRGPIFAWRPGWTATRPLSSERGLLCRSHARAAVAYCLDDVMGSSERPESVELRVGALDPAMKGPLPSFGRFRPHRQDGVSDWQAAFSKDGATFFFSSPDPDPTTTRLRAIPTRAVGTGTPETLVDRVGNWRVGHDGGRLYYLQREPGRTMDSLWLRNLATGATTRVADEIRSFELAGDGSADRGVTFHSGTGTGRAFHLLRDPLDRMTDVTVFSDHRTPESVRVASDLRHTAWITQDFVGRLVRHDNLESCLLATDRRSEVFTVGFFGQELVHWTEGGADGTDRRDAFVAPRNNCKAAQIYARGLQVLQTIAGRGVIFGDEYDDREAITLKYARLIDDSAGPRLGRAVRIAAGVQQYITVVGVDPAFVIFRSTPKSSLPPGFYLFGPIPFETAPSAP